MRSKAFVLLALGTFFHAGSAYFTPFGIETEHLSLVPILKEGSQKAEVSAAFQNNTSKLPASRHSSPLLSKQQQASQPGDSIQTI